MLVIPATQEAEVGGWQSEASPGKKGKYETHSEKQTKAERSGGMAQVVEKLPSKPGTMKSNQKKKLHPKSHCKSRKVKGSFSDS
jgi:hypothetical protein